MTLLSKVRDIHDASSRLLRPGTSLFNGVSLVCSTVVVNEAQKTISGTNDAYQNYLCSSPAATCGYQHTIQSDLVQAELILTSAIGDPSLITYSCLCKGSGAAAYRSGLKKLLGSLLIAH